MTFIFPTSNANPVLNTNKYYGYFSSYQSASLNAVADPDAVANSLWEEVPSFGSREAFPVERETVKEHSILEPEVTSKHNEDSRRMLDKLEHLWEGFGDHAYNEVSSAIFKRWTTSTPPDRQFLEKAVDLLAEFQRQPMRNMKDSLEWLEHLRTSDIDSKKYLMWVDEQYELLAHKKRKEFDDITLEKALNSLHLANWRDANDESAIVNSYLLNTKASLQPDIYLGSFGNSHLAVRMNSECVRPQEADYQTAESLGVTAINSNILLSMGSKILKGGKLIKLLFIPIGNIFSMKSSGYGMNASIFRKGDWRDTGIVLMLRIMKKKGTPGDFYIVKDLRSANTNIGEDGATLWENLGQTRSHWRE